MRKEKGITLIALIITVIILLILAGVAISSLGNSGLFSKSKDAVNKYQEAEKNESERLNEYLNELTNQTTPVEKIPIYTRADLEKVGSGVQGYTIKGKTYNMNNDAYYILMNDIDLIGVAWDEHINFEGIFDGNFKKLNNLTSVKLPGVTGISLFNSISNGVVKNLKLKIDIENNIDKAEIGGLTNEMTDSIIENCMVEGKIVEKDIYSYIGGIAAHVYGKNEIKNTLSNVNIIASDDWNVGGIIGDADSSEVKITNSYFTGSIIANSTENVGGISGKGGTISNCYNSGHIESNNSTGLTGAIIGKMLPDDNIQNTYYLATGTMQGDELSKSVDLSETEMKQKGSYVGFDFEKTWIIDEGTSYPRLRIFE